jgi:hypothetical protein
MRPRDIADYFALRRIARDPDEYEILHVADRQTLRRIERIHGEFHDVRPEDARTRIGDFLDFLEGHGFATCVAPHRKKSNHGMFFAHRKG